MKKDIKESVREECGKIARDSGSCCGSSCSCPDLAPGYDAGQPGCRQQGRHRHLQLREKSIE